MKWNKKGSAVDYAIILPIMFAGAIGVLLALELWHGIYNSGIRTTLPFSNTLMQGTETFATWGFNALLIMAFLAFFVGAIMLAAFARHHPIFAWVNVLICFALIMISVVLSNGYEKLTENPALEHAVARTGIFNEIMLHLPIISIVFTAILILAMFAFKAEASL